MNTDIQNNLSFRNYTPETSTFAAQLPRGMRRKEREVVLVLAVW
jgi:hypothetical protein